MAAAPQEKLPPALRLNMLGPFEARVHGRPLPSLRSRKGLWLLALLALQAGAEVEREWLAALLWPESPASRGLANLRNCLVDLRQALGPEAPRLRTASPRTLSFDVADAVIDVLVFDQAIAQGDTASLERAVALYRGPLLPGCVEEWAFQERQSREQACLRALELLAQQALDAGHVTGAEGYLRRAIAIDPFREAAHRALMQTLAAGGNYAAALLVYRELRHSLHREINAEPDPETRALLLRLREEARRRSVVPPSIPAPDLARQPSLPEGTVTFFFTDVVDSTRLWEQHGEAMRAALDRHNALLRQAVEAHEGYVFKTVGDQVCAAFALALDAVEAAVAAQRGLQAEPWGRVGALPVRMALHTGAAAVQGGDYLGLPLSRVSRLLAAGHGGQILLSRATQELVCDSVPGGIALRDLGEHRLKDLSRPEHIYQVAVPGLPADFPALDTVDLRVQKLPAQVTSLVGREKEVAQVHELLCRESVRLVTLTGPGGTGKTRVGLQAAAELLDQFRDGVFFVDLAPITEPERVVSAIAQALETREIPGQPLLQSLKEFLRAKQLMLLLDNFEQVLAAAPLVAELLASCPRLKVLVTSRTVLHLRGEHDFPVLPLPVPDPGRLPPVEALSQYAAVDLFIQRAVASRTDFTVNNRNAPAVAEICHRLDGLPLAIELAAARIGLFTPQALLSQLESRLNLLTGGPRDLPARQQTIRNTIEWSYALLDEPEKRLLRRVAVFRGGFSLELAAAIGDVAGDRDIDTLAGIASLVEQSLLQPAEGVNGEPRFRMLETIREYGEECLAGSGEAEAVRREHADRFLALAEEARIKLAGPDQRVWLDRLQIEHDNFRAALDWCYVAAGGAQMGLRLATALLRFWLDYAHMTEGRQHLARMLARDVRRTPERARALEVAGQIAVRQGDYADARVLCEESLAIEREQGHQRGIAWTLKTLGALFQEMGDFDRGRTLQEESLAICRERGARHMVASVLNDLGLTAVHQRRPAEARAFLEESLTIFREWSDTLGYSIVLNNLGLAALCERDWPAARSLFTESLAIKKELGMPEASIWALEGLAAVAAASRRPGRAAWLFGAAASIRVTAGTPESPSVRDLYGPFRGDASAQLGAEAFAAAWKQGHAAPLEQALECALEKEGVVPG